MNINKHRHGSPFDRGSADAYYGRAFDPHYYVGDTYNSVRLDEVDMSEKEMADYKEGYESAIFNEKNMTY
jgi:hypothetical protein